MDRPFAAFVTRLVDLLLAPVLLLGGVALVLELGFDLDRPEVARLRLVEVGVAAYYLLWQLLRVAAAPSLPGYLRDHWFELAVTLLLAVALALLFSPSPPSVAPGLGGTAPEPASGWVLRGFHALLFLVLASRLINLYRLIAYLKVHPSQLILLSFLGAILLGTGLLMVPHATTAPGGLPFLTALFTATSAICVTGLVLVDTGTTFTPFGQAILLAMIQLGGLGIMTVTSHFALFLAGGLGVKEGAMIQEMLGAESRFTARRLVRRILLLTLIFEGLGAVVLYYAIPAAGMAPGARLFNAVFHSVSAFCNAGFSLYSDSLVGFRANGGVLGAMMVLIVAGGLGFPALTNLFDAVRHYLRESAPVPVITVQTRLTLLATALLLGLGAAGFLTVEYEGALAGLSPWERGLAALFQSVTARTAGFNTVEIGALAPATVFLLMALMFIGASPGGTGGGIKTTTLAVTGAYLLAAAQGKEDLVVFRRTIPHVNIIRALAVFTLSSAIIGLFTFALALAERQPLLDLLFEVFSAFGTVGLSRGITARLSPAGQSIIIMAMFIGRLGTLTFLYAIVTHPKAVYRQYPSETVMVG